MCAIGSAMVCATPRRCDTRSANAPLEIESGPVMPSDGCTHATSPSSSMWLHNAGTAVFSTKWRVDHSAPPNLAHAFHRAADLLLHASASITTSRRTRGG